MLQLLTLTITLALAALTPESLRAEERFVLSGSLTGPSGPLSGTRLSLDPFDVGGVGNDPPGFDIQTDAQGRFEAEVSEGGLHLSVHPEEPLAPTEVTLTVASDLELRLRVYEPVHLAGEISLPAGFDEVPRLILRGLGLGATYDLPAHPGAFEVEVIPDVYSVMVRCPSIDCHRRFYFSRLNVDARSGEVEGIVLGPGQRADRVLEADPPRASLISVSSEDADGVATIRGAAGAVDGLSHVTLVNRVTGQYTETVSEADGSFEGRMFAPAGSVVVVRQDPTALFGFGLHKTPRLEETPGVLVQRPPETVTEGGFAGVLGFAMVEPTDYREFQVAGARDDGQLILTGSLPRRDWRAGEPLVLQGSLVLQSKAFEDTLDPSTVQVSVQAALERIFAADGSQTSTGPRFTSFLLTPTGMPVESSGGGLDLGALEIGALRDAGERRLEGWWSLRATIPDQAPDGIYRLELDVSFRGIPEGERRFDVFPTLGLGTSLHAGLLRIGSPAPPRLTWVLALDDFSNGTRGVVAIEDREHFQIASGPSYNTDTFVLPPSDTGSPPVLNLDPFVPLASADAQKPRVWFRFPSGELTATIHRPDGTVEIFGPAPFQQASIQSPLTPGGSRPAGGSNAAFDFYRLSTLSPELQYTFDRPGRYEIELSGFIEDVEGTRYQGGGTYEIFAAEHLDLEPGVVPGTPFEVGTSFHPR